MFFFVLCRDSYYSFADYGQTGVGLVRIVQLGRRPRWTRRRHQQEAVARDHKGPPPAIFHHIGCLYTPNTVRYPLLFSIFKKMHLLNFIGCDEEGGLANQQKTGQTWFLRSRPTEVTVFASLFPSVRPSVLCFSFLVIGMGPPPY